MSGKRPQVSDGEVVTKRHRPPNLEDVKINSKVTNLKTTFKNAFSQKQCVTDDDSGCCVNQLPFTHSLLPDFIQDSSFLDDLTAELHAVPFAEKNNDLYKFKQSSDLKKTASPCIAHLKKLLNEDFHGWLEEVTDIPLTSNVDIFCSQYKYTDVLLCHDDELEGRRIAFIFYLVPDSWGEADGGMLDLFDMDEHGQPNKVVKSVCPQRNCLLFFEVTEASFHQVAEILSESKCRLSVSGWYHGPAVPRSKPFVESLPPLISPNTIDEDDLYSWINPIYLNPEIQADIKEKFENDSEIELKDFLQDEKYKTVLQAMSDVGVSWSPQGPANKRNYDACIDGDRPEVLTKCVNFLQSDAMFLILSNLTGLKLHELAPSSDDEEEAADTSNGTGNQSKELGGSPQCRSVVRQWRHGSYTLIHDTDSEGSEYALDAFMYFGCPDWDSDNGGYTTYIAKGEDEELLTVCPSDNSLALVYRDKETLRFVKHVNHTITRTTDTKFFDIATVYYE
ncbi:prolyl 3-hydroxylase OGFOD1-like [Haliotis rufescens]|uniref:prolyl 3-hydroxylase OGFOD1-like n=1 Tax=Haliotis rufescens TaxID=6454 RepID=UPI001EB08EAA|nr:prolyl 3-hydroxylase OGFOD1-like [Haliotis rufescens]